MTKVLTVRIDRALLEKAEAKASMLGVDRDKYVESLIEDDLASSPGQKRHRFSSTDLAGIYGDDSRLGDERRGAETHEQGPVIVKEIADTGLIVALLFRNDRFHQWALEAFRKHAPFHTCEAVLAEAGSFCPNPVAVLQLVSRGDLIIDPDFSLAHEVSEVSTLSVKYADQPMDLADACLVRMSELITRCRIWTVDRNDFSTYRRHGRRVIPCQFPELA